MFSVESGGLGERMSCSKMDVRIQKGVAVKWGNEASRGAWAGRIAVPRASMVVANRFM